MLEMRMELAVEAGVFDDMEMARQGVVNDTPGAGRDSRSPPAAPGQSRSRREITRSSRAFDAAGTFNAQVAEDSRVISGGSLAGPHSHISGSGSLRAGAGSPSQGSRSVAPGQPSRRQQDEQLVLLPLRGSVRMRAKESSSQVPESKENSLVLPNSVPTMIAASASQAPTSQSAAAAAYASSDRFPPESTGDG